MKRANSRESFAAHLSLTTVQPIMHRRLDAFALPSPLTKAQCILAELEDVNEFSKKYHHRDNPGADTEPITDRELQAYVKRTLDIVGRF